MEPDQRNGYGYLHATASVLLNLPACQNELLIRTMNQQFSKRCDTVLIVHIYYEDLIDSIFDSHLTGVQEKCDLIVTVMQSVSVASLRKIKDKFENCFFIPTANRGRDIRPFIIALRRAHELGYFCACKLHTKKSLQLLDGDLWRKQLFESLLPHADSVALAAEQFRSAHNLGLLASERSLRDLSEPAAHSGNTVWLYELMVRIGAEKIVGNYNFRFPAGSMYWFRMDALSQLLDDDFVSLDEFELEAGQLDGTLAHAIERIVGLLPTHNHLEIDVIASTPEVNDENKIRGQPRQL